MIAINKKGGGFRGALNYDLLKEKGELIHTNLEGKSPRQFAKQFGVLRALKPDFEKPVFHVSLSLAENETLTNEQWQEVTNDYLEGMGFDKTMFVATKHNDAKCEHIHIVASRIGCDGKVVSDSNDYYLQMKVMRNLEQKYNLKSAAPVDSNITKKIDKNEIEMALRTGQASARMTAQAALDLALSDAENFYDYALNLSRLGVEMRLTLQEDNTKISGISYIFEGKAFKASELGKKYMNKGLAAQKLEYAKEADFNLIKELGFINVKTEDDRSPSDARGDTEAEDAVTTIDRTDGGSPDAISLSNGRTERELSPQNRAGDNASGADERAIHRDATGISQNSANASISSSTGGGSERAAELANDSALRDGEPVSRYFSGQLADLANASADGLQTNSADNKTRIERINKANQPSFEAAKKQMAALGVAKFEIGIRDEAGKKPFIKRTIYKSEFDQKYLNFLKAENARGKHIYLKPSGDHGLIFLDDIKPEALAEMQEQGFEPALTIETSPNNHQVWIKLSDTPLTPEVRREATKMLVRKFNGDTASMDAEHFGRLAGFTNRKAKYLNNGKYPFSKIKSATGQLASQAKAFLDEVISRLKTIREISAQKAKAQQKAEFQKSRVDTISKHRAQISSSNPKDEYKNQAQNIIKRYGEATDYSRMDFMISKSMIDKGFSHAQIAEAMEASSPNVEIRKAGHIDDYIQRTIKAAQNRYDLEKAEANAEYAMREANSPTPKF